MAISHRGIREYLAQNKWFFLVLGLIIGQVIFNVSYMAVKARPNARVYFYTLHIVPQIVCLMGLFSLRYWAWIGYMLVTGYNTFDLAKSLTISPAVFEGHFRGFMLATLCVNIIVMVILTTQKGYYE